MRPEPGWHGYWLNPGDAGLPMDVKWQLPKGFAAGPLRYPVPTPAHVADLMNYVFERDYAVLVRLKVPADAKGIVPIRADAHWLACTDKICVPEQGELSLDLPVGTGTPNRAQFDRMADRSLRSRLRRSASLRSMGTSSRSRSRCRRASRLREPYLFPITDNVVDYEAPQAFRRVGRLAGRRPADEETADAVSGCARIQAAAGGWSFTRCPGPVPEGGSADRRDRLERPCFGRCLGAIAGGILLNLMPCVFPILALKALHLSRAGRRERRRRRERTRSPIRAGSDRRDRQRSAPSCSQSARPGREAGWAFQLQDPRTIMLLLLLAVAITANLLGLFELPVLGGAHPAGRELRYGGARGVRRDTVRRSVPRSCARHGPVAACRRSGRRFRSARTWPGAPVPARRVHSCASNARCRSPAAGWIV